MVKDSVIIELKHLLDKAGISTSAAAINHLEITPKYLYLILSGYHSPSKKLRRRMEKFITTLKSSGIIAS